MSGSEEYIGCLIAYAFKAFEISECGELLMAQALARRKFEANGR